jgi:hypothetical protein
MGAILQNGTPANDVIPHIRIHLIPPLAPYISTINNTIHAVEGGGYAKSLNLLLLLLHFGFLHSCV